VGQTKEKNKVKMMKLKYEVTKDWTFKNWEFYLKFGFRYSDFLPLGRDSFYFLLLSFKFLSNNKDFLIWNK
jgi:hypothetical protein